MILRRLGNKKKLAAKLIPHFPDHNLYIDLFFGAGGMFFFKPKARFNILNDLDAKVYNLFQVAVHHNGDLRRLWEATPLHEALWERWKHGELPTDPVERATRFLLVSNFGFMGKPSTMRFASGNGKRLVLEHLAITKSMLWDCEFTCTDFRTILRKVPKSTLERKSTFIYADPPYLGTANNYVSGFKEQDSRDLLHMLVLSGSKFAMSEFDHPFITGLASELGLNVNIIGERKNLANRRTEILVTNYRLPDAC